MIWDVGLLGELPAGRGRMVRSVAVRTKIGGGGGRLPARFRLVGERGPGTAVAVRLLGLIILVASEEIAEAEKTSSLLLTPFDVRFSSSSILMLGMTAEMRGRYPRLLLRLVDRLARLCCRTLLLALDNGLFLAVRARRVGDKVRRGMRW